MAALSTSQPTLLDVAKRLDPDGKIANVVELLNETNEVLDDAVWAEGNLPTGDLTTVRTGIPAPTWRKLYGGVQPTKSTTRQVTDNCGFMEAYAEIDVKLANLNGNSAAWRLSEERPFIEGMGQELADTIFYGNEGTEPEAFTGLAPRYNSLSAESADNIIDAGGTGTDNASIWLVVWGMNTVRLIYPKGSKAGLQTEDKGQVTLEDASNGSNTGRMEAYRTHYSWDAGMSLRDWRYCVRICNIDKSDLMSVYASGTFATGANLPKLMFRAMRKIKNLNMGRPAFYMSRDIATWVSEQTVAMGQNGLIRSDNVAGDLRFTERFHSIPMRRVDALAGDETRVT